MTRHPDLLGAYRFVGSYRLLGSSIDIDDPDGNIVGLHSPRDRDTERRHENV